VDEEADYDYTLKSADAGRWGRQAEHLVAAFCILATRGALNVSFAFTTPFASRCSSLRFEVQFEATGVGVHRLRPAIHHLAPMRTALHAHLADRRDAV
jgi:hypothetical protein